MIFSAQTHDRFFALALDPLHAATHQVLVTASPAFRHPSWGPIVYTFAMEGEGRVNRAWRDLPGDGSVHCFLPETGTGFWPVNDASFLAALGTDGRITLERRGHAPGESPCVRDSPESWAFSSEAMRLMR